MTTLIDRIEGTHARLEGARAIVDAGLVEDIGNGHYIVLSQRGREHYNVDARGCDCPDSARRFDVHHGWCKHRLAVTIYKEQAEMNTSAKEKPVKPINGEGSRLVCAACAGLPTRVNCPLDDECWNSRPQEDREAAYRG